MAHQRYLYLYLSLYMYMVVVVSKGVVKDNADASEDMIRVEGEMSWAQTSSEYE